MPTLIAHVNSIDFRNGLQNVKELLNQSDVKITFWGERKIQVNGFEGYISLSLLVKKVINTAKSPDNIFLMEERMCGREIIHILENLYEQTDTLGKTKNFITRIFLWIRNSMGVFTARYYLGMDVTRNYFLDFNRDDFFKIFVGQNIFEKNLQNHPCYLGHSKNKIYAKEKVIDELANHRYDDFIQHYNSDTLQEFDQTTLLRAIVDLILEKPSLAYSDYEHALNVAIKIPNDYSHNEESNSYFYGSSFTKIRFNITSSINDILASKNPNFSEAINFVRLLSDTQSNTQTISCYFSIFTKIYPKNSSNAGHFDLAQKIVEEFPEVYVEYLQNLAVANCVTPFFIEKAMNLANNIVNEERKRKIIKKINSLSVNEEIPNISFEDPSVPSVLTRVCT